MNNNLGDLLFNYDNYDFIKESVFNQNKFLKNKIKIINHFSY
jgi:hypothetical protein